MRDVEMTISSKTGMLPPTSPVFPPCGTTANLFSLQYFRTLLTSSVDLGLNTSLVCPRYLRIQSLLNASRSSPASAVTPSMTADESTSVDRKNLTCSDVSSENRESRFRDGYESVVYFTE